MAMQCVKTGCHLYSREYGKSYYGDLYFQPTGFKPGNSDSGEMEIVGIWMLKSAQWAYAPMCDVLHCIVGTIDIELGQPDGRVILIFTDVEMFDYEGQPLTKVEETDD